MNRRQLLEAIAAGAPVIASGNTTMQAARQRPLRRPREIVTDDGTRLYFRDWGRGCSILFLAPWAMTCGWWDYHLASLSAEGFRCIAFDRRGHGRSDEPADGYDFDTLADDVQTVITALGLRDVLLVGHSVGAAEAVRSCRATAQSGFVEQCSSAPSHQSQSSCRTTRTESRPRSSNKHAWVSRATAPVPSPPGPGVFWSAAQRRVHSHTGRMDTKHRRRLFAQSDDRSASCDDVHRLSGGSRSASRYRRC